MGFNLIHRKRSIPVFRLSDDTVEAKYFICATCCEVFCCSIDPEEMEPVNHTACTTGEPDTAPETPPELCTYYCPTCGNLLHEM